MKKIHKFIIIAVLQIFFLAAVPCVNASASSYGLYDLDDSLTQSEEQLLEDKMHECSDKLGINIAIVITSDKENKSSMAYADDYYDKLFGINTQGILFMIDNEDRDHWISTSGDAPKYTIKRYQPYIDTIFDDITPDLRADRYYETCNVFLDGVQKYSNKKLINTVAVSAVISLVISAVTYLIISSGYKKQKKYSARNYTASNQSEFTEKSDIFIREYTRKVKIETNSSSGSHGSGHISSGGGHHGGGGRHI